MTFDKNKSMIYKVFLASAVESLLETLPQASRGQVKASITFLEDGDFRTPYTKKLKGVVRELIVGDYRFIFFIKGSILYFTSAFRKKTAKTPQKEIELAEKYYKLL